MQRTGAWVGAEENGREVEPRPDVGVKVEDVDIVEVLRCTFDCVMEPAEDDDFVVDDGHTVAAARRRTATCVNLFPSAPGFGEAQDP